MNILNRPIMWVLYQLNPDPKPVSLAERFKEGKNVCSITIYETEERKAA